MTELHADIEELKQRVEAKNLDDQKSQLLQGMAEDSQPTPSMAEKMEVNSQRSPSSDPGAEWQTPPVSPSKGAGEGESSPKTGNDWQSPEPRSLTRAPSEQMLFRQASVDAMVPESTPAEPPAKPELDPDSIEAEDAQRAKAAAAAAEQAEDERERRIKQELADAEAEAAQRAENGDAVDKSMEEERQRRIAEEEARLKAEEEAREATRKEATRLADEEQKRRIAEDAAFKEQLEAEERAKNQAAAAEQLKQEQERRIQEVKTAPAINPALLGEIKKQDVQLAAAPTKSTEISESEKKQDDRGNYCSGADCVVM